MKFSRRQDINQTLTGSSHTRWIDHCMEVVGRIWASYWLLICASFLVVASVVPTWRGGHWCTSWNAWLKFPYSFNVGGWEFPVQARISCPTGVDSGHLYFRDSSFSCAVTPPTTTKVLSRIITNFLTACAVLQSWLLPFTFANGFGGRCCSGPRCS